MTPMPIGIDFDLDVFHEPSLIVSSDGVVQAFNRATSLILSRVNLSSSLFEACASPVDTLRRYLLHCASPGPPTIRKLDFYERSGVSEFHCLGSLVPRRNAGQEAAAVLLRLFLVRDDAAVAEEQDRGGAGEPPPSRQFEALRRDRRRLGSQLALLADALKVVEEQNRELRSEMKFIRADERERIARDIHDQVGHEMALVLAEVRTLRNAAQGADRDSLDAIAEHVSDVGRRMHRAVIGGRPRIVEELGLARALQVTVVAFAADGGLRSSFEQTGVARKSVPAPVESALYRIAQEAMTNVMKHAPDARNLSAVLSFSNEAVSLTISDDGPGFAPQPSPHNGRDEGGTGLRGMQHRMRDVGGTLTIETHPGGGTTILASVPLAPEPERAGGS